MKRRRVEAPAPAAEDASAAGAAVAAAATEPASSTVLVQLARMGHDDAIGPTLDMPVDATPKQLELIVHKLLSDSDGKFAFYLGDDEVTETLQAALSAKGLSTESVHTVRFQPLSLFRVLPVTRCSDSLPGHTEAILHVSFSPDGAVLGSGGGDATVRFWDGYTCLPKSVCSGHKHHVLSTAWSPDGRFFASGDKNGEVRVWNPRTGKEVCAPLTAHTAWVTSLAWEPLHSTTSADASCELLASASKDRTVRVWNVRTGATAFSLTGHSDSVEAVRWGGEGLIYTASRDRTIIIWAVDADKTRAKVVRTLSGHGHRVNSLALNTDYALRTGPFGFEAGGKPPAFPDAAAARDAARARYARLLTEMGGKELLVSCSDDFTLFLWEPANDKRAVVRMTGHQAVVNHIAFSPDGRLLASASFDKKVKLWEARTGKFLLTLVGHVGPVYQVCWSADSRFLASASRDSTVKVWAARPAPGAKPVALHTLSGHADEVYALDWSPNGEMLASGSKDRLVKIWRH